MNKTKKSILVIVLIVSLIGNIISLFALVIYTWALVDFRYTGDIEFYNGEKIVAMYNDNPMMFFVTEDKTFIAGNHTGVSYDFEYAVWADNGTNYELFSEGDVAPALVIEQKAKQVIPNYNGAGALLLTESGELYTTRALKIKKIADNVSFVDYDVANDKIYYLDNSSKLYIMNNKMKPQHLSDGIKTINVRFGKAFALTTSDELCELLIDENYNCTRLSPIKTNVEKFEVFDSSLRMKDGKESYDEEAPESLLFNVLTKDKKLWVKGAYNAADPNFEIDEFDFMRVYSDWETIGEDVVDFSGCRSGTVMLFEGGRAVYIGFECNKDFTKVIFDTKELASEGAEFVNCNLRSICVIKGDTIWLWGDVTSNFNPCPTHIYGVHTGGPLILPRSYSSKGYSMGPGYLPER